MTDVPELWWSPELGIVARVGGVIRSWPILGRSTSAFLDEPPDDGVSLVPEEPVDEKGRGESYWRGHADGRMAERAGTPDLQWSVDGAREVLRSLQGQAYVYGGVEMQEDSTMGQWARAMRDDPPPFAPEPADAALPVLDSTLPAEIEENDRG